MKKLAIGYQLFDNFFFDIYNIILSVSEMDHIQKCENKQRQHAVRVHRLHKDLLLLFDTSFPFRILL